MRTSPGSLVAIALTLATATASHRLAAQVGEIAFVNSGAAAAQASFLAGLAQLHNFEYAAAAELFRAAQQLDPGFAMAYWGEAMTYNHAVWMEQDLSSARKALARLAPTRDGRAATAKTAREKDYMRAAEILYGEGGKQARDIAYADAMADLHRAYPEDADAAAFYALSLLGTAHAGRDFTIYMRAASIVEPVFRDHPNHPGAAHYLIHAYDDPIHAPLGLRAARAYSKIAPSAAHAQHMTSHIFLALGLWDDLVTANEAGVRVADEGRSRRGLAPSACGHYNFWLEYGYLQQRRFAKAKTLVANCYAAARRIPAAAPEAVGGQVLDPDNSPAASLAAMRLRYLLDSEHWTSDVVAWTVETNGQWRPQVAFEFGTGYAAARSGRRADAAAAFERLTHARHALDTALTRPAESDEMQAREWARILEGQLSALIQSVDGRNAGAVDAMRALSAAEDQLPYEFGPPAIDKPSHELLGETLLALDRPAEARVAFERALARTPERTAALQGLMLAAAKSGDERKATEIRARLQSIWHLADELPALR
jgi:tetratricopeptide (TPR) repeat protein